MSTASELEPVLKPHPVKRGEPAWDLAWLYPLQGHWTEEEYLALDTNRMIELSNGCLEFLPMPVPYHQRIVQFLFEVLKAWVIAHRLGEVFLAPCPVRLWPGEMREPDIFFLRPGRLRDPRRSPDGADLAMEVVSPGEEARERDLITKPHVYAQARIPEYWIVDPERQRITVLTLVGADYQVHGEFAPGTQATSVLLNGFAVDVTAVFAAGDAAAGNGQA